MKKLLTLACLLALAACGGTDDYKPVPVSFSNVPPLRVNVAEIRVIDAYQPPLRIPNVEHEFPTPPAKAINDWAHQRLIAAGHAGILEVTIENASVKEQPLKMESGVSTWFSDQQSAQFNAVVTVTMKLYKDATGISTADAEVDVTRSHTIGEHSSIADRERVFDEMTREIMDQFDAQAQKQMRAYMGQYLS